MFMSHLQGQKTQTLSELLVINVIFSDLQIRSDSLLSDFLFSCFTQKTQKTQDELIKDQSFIQPDGFLFNMEQKSLLTC